MDHLLPAPPARLGVFCRAAHGAAAGAEPRAPTPPCAGEEAACRTPRAHGTGTGVFLEVSPASMGCKIDSC